MSRDQWKSARPIYCKLAGGVGSSCWIHDTFPAMSGFAWQNGYAAYSVSCSQLGGVKDYFSRQEEHHRVRTFQDEYREFLRVHDLEWEEPYIWD